MFIADHVHYIKNEKESVDNVDILLRLHVDNAGVEMVFKIWWSFHLVFLVNIYLTANLYIYLDASRNFPELGSLRLPGLLSRLAHPSRSEDSHQTRQEFFKVTSHCKIPQLWHHYIQEVVAQTSLHRKLLNTNKRLSNSTI